MFSIIQKDILNKKKNNENLIKSNQSKSQATHD